MKTVTFSNDLVIRKYQYQEYLIEEGGYTANELVEMSMTELRTAVDELLPIMVMQTSNTMRGGRSKKVTIVKRAS